METVTKRFLSLLVAVVMVLSMVPTTAFATTENTDETTTENVAVEETTGTDTLPDAEVSVLTPLTLPGKGYMVWPSGDDTIDRPVQIVMEFKANDTLAEAKQSKYGKYKCDFYLSFTGIEGGSLMADGCYLAGNYGTYGWIVIPTDGLEVENGVEYPVVSGYDANLTYENICDYVKDFIASIYITDEILNSNPNFRVSLALKMTSPDGNETLCVGEPAVYDVAALKKGNQYIASYNTFKAEYESNISSGYAGGQIDTDANAEAIAEAKEALKSLNANLTDEQLSTAEPEIIVTFTDAVFELGSVPSKVSYDVSPMLSVADSSVKITELNEAVTFKLPVYSGETRTKANVYHNDDLLGVYAIEEDNGRKYVEVSSAQFSTYTVEPVNGTEPATEVSTLAELQDALADNAAQIVLTADITLDSSISVPDGTVIDLNGKTLYVNVENSYYNNATIQNGNIVLGKPNVHVCDGYFLVNAGKTLVLNGVNVSSSAEGIKTYAVFHLKTGANLDLIDCTLDIANNEYSAGYVVYAGESTATVDITGTTLTAKSNGIVHATTVIEDSQLTIEAVEHGINRSGVTIDDSTVTISGGTGRGITAQHGDLVITGNSVVNISNMGEATIELRNDKNLDVADTADVTVDVAVNNTTNGIITGEVKVPLTGNNGNAHTGAHTIWGQANVNASKSMKLELYCGDMLVGTTVLVQKTPILSGSAKEVSWNFYLTEEAEAGDGYWDTTWETGHPNVNAMPDKVVLYLDGEKVDEDGVLLSGPDSINKVYAAISTDGVITGFATTLQAAVDAADGKTVTLLRDVSLTDTLNIAAGTTVTLDLNGKTVSQTKAQTGGYSMIQNDGNLTIQDSVGGGKISYTDSGNGGEYVSNTITNRGTLTLKSGTVENLSSSTVASNGYPYAIDTSIWGAAAEVNTIIEGGKVYCESYSSMRLRADSETESVNITVTGGEVYGRIEVQNPTSNKASKGMLTISGGEIYKNNSSKAIMFFANGSSGENMKASITGGMIDGAVGYSNTFGPVANFDENIISGGTFTTDVSQFCAEGFKASDEDGDGVFEIAKTLIGTGTEADPFQINDLDDLKLFRDTVNAGTTYDNQFVVLNADIDLKDESWTPIGNASTKFLGTFDGQNHTISNLNVSVATNNAGLFGFASVIKNVKINNATISGVVCVGALVGELESSVGTVDNCHVTGTIQITGENSVGGLAGKGYANIRNSSVTGDADSFVLGVYGDTEEGDNVGGIIGHLGEGNTLGVSNSTVKNITVKGTRKVGGIVGTTARGNDMIGCAVEGVTVESTATAEYANDNASTTTIGGIVGNYFGSATTGGVLKDCSVKDLTLVLGNAKSAGALAGGDRNNNGGAPIGVDTVSGNTVSNVTGATNLYFMVAKVGDQGYTSLQAAIDAADGKTVTLLQNVALANTLKITSEVTLDLNGKTITSSASCAVKVSGGNADLAVKISNGSIVAAAGSESNQTSALNVYDGADVVLESVALSGGYYGVKLAGSYQYPSNIENNNLTSVVFNGGSVTADNAAIIGLGAYPNTQIDINGATVTSNDSIAIYHPSYGTLNITAGKITGTTAIYLKAGKLNISGGEIVANGEYADYAYNYSGANATGDAVVVESCNYGGYPTPVVAITGGTFTSANNKAVASYNSSDAEAVTGFISGGTFSSDVSDLCVEGYKVASSTDAEGNTVYGVVVDPAYGKVAKIGDMYYEDLATAIAEATAGATVELIADEEITSTIVVDKKLTLNLGSSTITATGCHALTVRAGANITITADSENPGGITSNKNAIYANYTDSKGAKTIVINGGVFNGSCTFNAYGSTGGKANPLSVTINGGHFKKGISGYQCYYFTANGGTFDGSVNFYGGHTTHKTYFNGGLYKNKPMAVANKIFVNGVWYKEAGYNRLAKSYDACEAIIGTNYYRYVAEALSAAANGNTVKLLKAADVSTAGQIALHKTVTLDLNSMELTGNVAEVAGKLIVTSGTLADTAVAPVEGYEVTKTTETDGSTVYTATVPNANAAAKLDGVNYLYADDAITAAVSGSVLELYGTASKAKTLKADETLTIVYGENASYDDSLIAAAKGYKIERTPAEGGSTVVYKAVFDITQYEAKIGDTYYLTLSNAFAAVGGTEGQTIVVLKDIKNGGYIVNQSASFTLDLNGHSVALTSSGGSTGRTYNFTIDDTSAEGDGIFSPSTLSGGEIAAINGGQVITTKNITANCAEGLASMQTEDGKWIVTAVEAKIGETYYETLGEAFNAAQAGDTITLLRDVTASEIIKIEKAITLDGNGKTLTSTATRAINVNCDGEVTIKGLTVATTANTERAINVIQKPAKLTLENVTAEGFKYTVNVAGSGAGSSITIEGGKFSGYAAIYIGGSNVTLTANNAELIGVNDVPVHASNTFGVIAINYGLEGSSVTVNGGTLTAISTTGNRQFIVTTGDSKGTVKVAGATLNTVNGDVFNGVPATMIASFPAEYADELNAQGYVVSAPVDGLVTVEATAEASFNGVNYASLSKALMDAYAAGGKVTLLTDCELTDMIASIPAGVTLDLNGNTLKVNNIWAFGQIVDGTAGGDGVLIANGNVILDENNVFLPLYDAAVGGYRFYSYGLRARKVESSGSGVSLAFKYYYAVDFANADAYLLLEDTANSGARLIVDLKWTDMPSAKTVTYQVSDETVAKFAREAYIDLTEEGKEKTTYTIVISVAGLQGLVDGTEVVATLNVYTNTSVVSQGAAKTGTIGG